MAQAAEKGGHTAALAKVLEAQGVWPLLGLPTPSAPCSPLQPGGRPRATCQAPVSSLSPAYVPYQVLNSSGNEQGLTQSQNDLSRQAEGSENKAAPFVQHLQNTSGSNHVWRRTGRPGSGTQREKAAGPPCRGPKKSVQFN